MPSSSGRVNTVSMAAEGRSASVPFLKQQPNLDGSMAGDVGFDPLGLSNINDVGVDLYWLREAEIKHGRLGMLAAAGILFVEAFGPRQVLQQILTVKWIHFGMFGMKNLL